MAQATTVTINNGAAVATTFTPEQVTPELTTLVDRSAGVAARFRRLSVRYSPATMANKKGRTSMAVSAPIWGTLSSGAEGVVRTLRSKVEFELPDGCTDAERLDLYAFTVNGLQNTLLQGALRDHDPLY